MVMVAYVFIVAVALISVYAVCRLIDHFLSVREDKISCAHKVDLLTTATENVKWLSDEFVKKINDTVMEQYEKMGD